MTTQSRAVTAELAAQLRADGKSDQLVPLPDDRLNFETPLHLVEQTRVPTPLFFCRSNYEPPSLRPEAWRARLDGLIGSPMDVRLADLQQLPQRTLVTWLECAGNSRSRFEAPTEGNQWGDNAV